jgi:addiction module HigA family antidote
MRGVLSMKKPAVLVPGNVLKEEYLDEYQISITQLASDIGLSVSAVRQIISNKAKISLHIAKRLAKYFNTTVDYWVELQTRYDLVELDRDADLNEELKRIPKAKKQAVAKDKDAGKKPKGKSAASEPAPKKPRKPREKKVKEEVAETEEQE